MVLERKVLVVEDSVTQALALAHMLEGQGYKVTVASDADRAMVALSEGLYAAVVLDFHLPGMRGDELCRRIRQNVGTRGVPIIMLTSEGSVELASIDSGADFHLTKPIDNELLIMRLRLLVSKSEQHVETPATLGTTLRQARILAVDDSPTYLSYLVQLLTDEGYAVTQARSGVEALALIKLQRFDGVVLDLVMPDMDGIAVCKEIHQFQDRGSDAIVLLLLTSHENKEEMTRGLAAGADDFVGKSSDLAVLKARIRALLRRKFLQEENKRIVEELKNKELEALRARAKQEVAEARAALVEKLEATADELRRSNEELEKAKLEAFKASDAKSSFLANMSHEIRTPINGVLGTTTLLELTELDEQQADYVGMIKRSAESLLTVINDILDFSKVEAGRLELELVDFDLNQLVDDAERTFVYAASQKGLRLIVSKPREFATLFRGDPGRLRQILLNLLSNAVKFTLAGDVTLNVAISKHDDTHTFFLFEVIDSGVGIPEAVIGRLFQAFSQADASTTRRFGGTGLGLSICKHLVQLMQGEIGVQSQEQKGSRFWFTVPLARGPARRRMPETDEAVAAPMRAAHILVAEDNPINQKVALGMLAKLGHSAVVVGDGHGALRALRETDFDIVLMDCQMPQLDGYETTAQIRKSATLRDPKLPIIAMTANAIKGDRERCLAAGMDDYIAKPVSLPVLANVLKRWLGHAEAAKVAPGREAGADALAPAIDQATLEAVIALDNAPGVAMLVELIDCFVDVTTAGLAAMRSAVRAGDAAKLGFEAHAVKGGGASLGAARLASLCAELELLNPADDAPAVLALIDEVEKEFGRAKRELDARVRQKAEQAA